MKTLSKLRILLFSVLLTMGFTACQDEENKEAPIDNYPELQLGVESLRFKAGSENKVKLDIVQGSGEYNAFSLDTDIVKVSIENDEIVVEGIRCGETVIIVSDKSGSYRKIPVSTYTEVMTFDVDKVELVTRLGSSGSTTFNIVLGNGGYTVTSDNNKVSATVMEKGEIMVTSTSGLDEFNAILTITDSNGVSGELPVTVKYTMEPYSEKELEQLKADPTRNYVFNDKPDGRNTMDSPYTRFTNTTAGDGTITYGWSNGSFKYNISFKGDKTVGTKTDALLTFNIYNQTKYTNQPINLEIIKNDGVTIWGVWSFLEGGNVLQSGYFCDSVN